MNPSPKPSGSSKTSKNNRFSRLWATLPLATLLFSSPALAQDPFRTGSDARPIGPTLESAFEDFFRTGEFQDANQKLNKAQSENPNEPLVYTLQAALAYQNGQREKMLAMTQKTRDVAQAIEAKDPGRSHLYRGIAQGLEGSSYYLKDGFLGLPKALTYVTSMFLEIDRARQLTPQDPEVNLFVGYIDLLLNKYDDALKEFRKAGPPYLALRGQALVLRDTKAYPQAQAMAEKALVAAPRNAELHYLKAQTLALQNKPEEALASFNKALELGKQLPPSTKTQLMRERDTQIKLVAASKAVSMKPR
jgi:tetratricopeptide (TPR) repeat protein